MVQQKPASLHKIIFTITCEGETLYDAQKFASDVHVALRDYHISMKKGVTIDMTVEKVKPDNTDFSGGTSTLPNDIQLSWTETV